jgi:hypothetical protein
MEVQGQIHQVAHLSELSHLIECGLGHPLKGDIHSHHQRRAITGQATQRLADKANVVWRTRHHTVLPTSDPERIDAKHKRPRFQPELLTRRGHHL